MNEPCPCGSERPFSDCCDRFLNGGQRPRTAEQLMRSRYSAFARGNIAYLRDTLWPKHQPQLDEAAVARWAADNHWAGLTVIETSGGGETDREGTVLFEARYLAGGSLHTHRERSRFRKKAGRWYYVEALPEA